MQIRPIEPEEYARLGALTLEAYTKLDGHVPEPEYEDELYDVRTRAEAHDTLVLVAVDDDGNVLGGVTHARTTASPFHEGQGANSASIRMLAVDATQRGAGIGEALVRECIAIAKADGRDEIVLHSTPWMTAAHRLYLRLGFVRDESLDWKVDDPPIDLLGFRLRLLD